MWTVSELLSSLFGYWVGPSRRAFLALLLLVVLRSLTEPSPPPPYRRWAAASGSSVPRSTTSSSTVLAPVRSLRCLQADLLKLTLPSRSRPRSPRLLCLLAPRRLSPPVRHRLLGPRTDHADLALHVRFDPLLARARPPFLLPADPLPPLQHRRRSRNVRASSSSAARFSLRAVAGARPSRAGSSSSGSSTTSTAPSGIRPRSSTSTTRPSGGILRSTPLRTCSASGPRSTCRPATTRSRSRGRLGEPARSTPPTPLDELVARRRLGSRLRPSLARP